MDEEGWSEYDDTGEWLWREDRLAPLLDGIDGDDVLFVSGCARNQWRFYPRFDHIVLLSVPQGVMLERIAERTSNDFGKAPHERAAILRDIEEVEPLLRTSADVEIDTQMSLDQVVSLIEDVARR